MIYLSHVHSSESACYFWMYNILHLSENPVASNLLITAVILVESPAAFLKFLQKGIGNNMCQTFWPVFINAIRGLDDSWFCRVLTLVYNTQNYWVFGPCPLSGFQ
jgi:hypothetical protein